MLNGDTKAFYRHELLFMVFYEQLCTTLCYYVIFCHDTSPK